MYEKWNKVYIVGAGPGDPELLTVKADKIIREADVIIYANSLITDEIVNLNKYAKKIESYGLTLEEIVAYIKENFPHKKVVRIHSGDPSIYSSIFEETEKMKELGIPFEVVPGVSSFLAASARIAKEYTLPGVSQTLILTRVEGKTPVPEREKLVSLAKHKTSMVLFLSVGHIDEVEKDLLTSYPPDTPVVIAYKVSRPDEKIVKTRLSRLSNTVKREGIERTALILIGEFLEPPSYVWSYLYNKKDI